MTTSVNSSTVLVIYTKKQAGRGAIKAREWLFEVILVLQQRYERIGYGGYESGDLVEELRFML